MKVLFNCISIVLNVKSEQEPISDGCNLSFENTKSKIEPNKNFDLKFYS